MKQPLSLDQLGNHLHGGAAGYHKKLWQIRKRPSIGVPVIGLSYTSPHLEEGYPGTLSVQIDYQLSEENELVVDYTARIDRPTVVSLTNHSYFNLAGNGEDVRTHQLQILADEFTPLNGRYLPTGSREPVAGSDVDTRQGLDVGTLFSSYPTLHYGLAGHSLPALAAQFHEPVSDRVLSVWTTAPGLQVYGGELLDKPFGPFAGVCLEPQHYPDAPNQPNFPNPVL